MTRASHDVHDLLTVTVNLQSPDPALDENKKDYRTCKVDTSPDVIWLFFGLLETNDAYRYSAIQHWTLDSQVRTHLILSPSLQASLRLDNRGSSLASSILWRAIEQEDALHWLSTLGGAFSNLGEASQDFAQVIFASPSK